VIVRCALYRGGRRAGEPADISDALDEIRALGDPSAFVWLGLADPDHRELAAIGEEFSLHPLALEDAESAHQRPKLDRYEGSLFTVFKTIQEPDPAKPFHIGEISVFLGNGFIVTVRHGVRNPLDGLRDRVEANPKLLSHGPSAVLYAVADAIVDTYVEYADHMQNVVDDLESDVFSPQRGDYSASIYAVKRNAMSYSRMIIPLMQTTNTFITGAESTSEDFIAPETQPYFRDVGDHVFRVAESAREWNQLLNHMFDADLARVSVRQNEDMRRISAWAAILAVPTMIAGIYGMNFHNMPELSWHWGYYIVLAIILGSCVALYVLLRRAKWL
jgi:magnesium transporter